MRPFPPIAGLMLLAACTDPALDGANDQQNAEFGATASPKEANMTDASPQNLSNPISQDQAGPNQASSPAGPKAGPDQGTDGADQCNAGKYQYLVGQSRSRIPDAASGSGTRITCTTCPMTMDYSSSRLNILYDEKTEIIEEVKCG